MTEVALAFARRASPDARSAMALPAGARLFVQTRGQPDALVVSEGPLSRDELAHALSPSLILTVFARCRPVGTLPTPAEPRATRGLLVGATDCGDEGALDEFHAFYDGIHAREVLDSGIYWRARRFERVSSVEGDAPLPRFFALYDTERPAADAYRALRKHPMTTDWPRCFLVRNVWSFDAA